MTLGVVDWGIGGLGLVGHLDRIAPELPVVYWSDTGAAPYGMLPAAALASRLGRVVDELVRRGCGRVLLACNAASTVVGRVDADAPVPVSGVIESGIAAVPDTAEIVGVVGGARTIRSGAYRRGLARPGRRIVSRVAQPLSAHIEAGRMSDPTFDRDLRRIVRPLRDADAVVLACTHYPAASEQFAAALPGVRLVDPVEGLAETLASTEVTESSPVDPTHRFFTTGDPEEMRRSAATTWGWAPDHVDRVGPARWRSCGRSDA